MQDPEHFNNAYRTFSLFWAEHFWNTIAANTNRYALLKGAKEEMPAPEAKQRAWYRTIGAEIKVFVGVTIYIGIHHDAEISDCGNIDPTYGPNDKFEHHRESIFPTAPFSTY